MRDLFHSSPKRYLSSQPTVSNTINLFKYFNLMYQTTNKQTNLRATLFQRTLIIYIVNVNHDMKGKK